MSGPSLTHQKLDNLVGNLICVSNTFSVKHLKNSSVTRILYFISDPKMIFENKKYNILQGNMQDDRVRLIIPYRFLRNKRVWYLIMKYGFQRISFYRDNLLPYKKCVYTFLPGIYPNLQSVFLDVVLPYTVYNYNPVKINIYGVDLNYGDGLNKEYGLTTGLEEKNSTNGESWNSFVLACFIFYRAILVRHYEVDFNIDTDSGLYKMLNSSDYAA